MVEDGAWLGRSGNFADTMQMRAHWTTSVFQFVTLCGDTLSSTNLQAPTPPPHATALAPTANSNKSPTRQRHDISNLNCALTNSFGAGTNMHRLMCTSRRINCESSVVSQRPSPPSKDVVTDLSCSYLETSEELLGWRLGQADRPRVWAGLWLAASYEYKLVSSLEAVFQDLHNGADCHCSTGLGGRPSF